MSKFTRRIIAAEIARRVADELEEEAKRDAERNAELLRGAELLRDVALGAEVPSELVEVPEVKIPSFEKQTEAESDAEHEASAEANTPVEIESEQPAGTAAAETDVASAVAGTAAAGAGAGTAGEGAAGEGTPEAAAGQGERGATTSTADAVAALTQMAFHDAYSGEGMAEETAGQTAAEDGAASAAKAAQAEQAGQATQAANAVQAVPASGALLEQQDGSFQAAHVVSVTAVQTSEDGAVTPLPAPSGKTMPVPIEGRLSTSAVRVPQEIRGCSGILVNGHRIKSFAYSTDVAVIHNTNADAILAVYPFTGHPQIMKAIQSVAKAPVFTGVGGGTTMGQRVLELAMFAEMQGMMGVVLNAPSSVETVERVAATVDIPVMVTILDWDDFARAKIEAGAKIINVAAGFDTVRVVREIRKEYPDLPVVATGGTKPESIKATIEAGANAISWTPPSAVELQGMMMDQYRDNYAAGIEMGHGNSDANEHVGRLSSWLADKGL